MVSSALRARSYFAGRREISEPGDQTDALRAKRMPYEEQRDRKAETDPYDVLFQVGPFFRPSEKIPS